MIVAVSFRQAFRRISPRPHRLGWAVSIGHGDTMLCDQLLEDFDRLFPA
jgi:hypothetical protein